MYHLIGKFPTFFREGCFCDYDFRKFLFTFEGMRAFYKFMFWLFGWKVEGKLPDLKKYLVIGAPHTSYWDFFVGVAARSLTRLHHAKFLAKKELFDVPLQGWILRKMGGYPVERSKNTNLVDRVIEIFDQHEEFVLGMAPEGTRKRVEKFKTGFYHIAVGAKIPIVFLGLNFGDKQVELRPPFYPTGNFEEDMEFILNYFRGIKGKYPEKGVF